jgi:hypothetical protein
MPDFDRNAKLRQIERNKFEALSSENVDVDIDSQHRIKSDDDYSIQ